MSFVLDVIKIQRWCGALPDGHFGPVTARAVVEKLGLGQAQATEWHKGNASSFADPADVRAFKRCRAQGKSELECFNVGDNGIGVWDDDTTEGSGPSCALPPDDMIERFGSIAAAKHATVIVEANGRSVTVMLKDRMPYKKNITNGAVIDLNPDASAALGFQPPFMVKARWKWAG